MALPDRLPRQEPVAAMIPAYNEEQHIGRVLSILTKMASFAQFTKNDPFPNEAQANGSNPNL